MTRNDASTARAHSTLHSISKQRPAKHGGDAQINMQERAVHRQAVSIYQAATETSHSREDIRGRWVDDGGQNTIRLMDDAQSI
jgi:hypothetical protein